MQRLTTFEDIFNKLIEEYQGNQVTIETKQEGISINQYFTTLKKIKIKPLNKIQSKKWDKKGRKIGLIVLKGQGRGTNTNIPFILGFNTMQAIFLKKGVSIKSLNMEFIIKKASNKRRSA